MGPGGWESCCFVWQETKMWHLISWLVPSLPFSVWELHFLPLSQAHPARKTFLIKFWNISSPSGPGCSKVDNSNQWINRYPADKKINVLQPTYFMRWIATYPLDNVICSLFICRVQFKLYFNFHFLNDDSSKKIYMQDIKVKFHTSS